MQSPLEQFEIIPLVKLQIGYLDLSFTNASLMILISFSFLITFILATKEFDIIPSRWQGLLENFYTFTAGITSENIGKKGQQIFPFIFSLFTFLIFTNITGLIPYSFTVTSHIVVTLTLSLIVWVGKLVIGIKNHGFKLLGVFLPEGIPFAIVPFFVVVETLSFIIPLAALGIRLFANIIAGHILLKVIAGFCWSIIATGGVLFVAHFLPLSVLFLLLFLETAVAFIQAYVFTMLACLITGDIIRGGH